MVRGLLIVAALAGLLLGGCRPREGRAAGDEPARRAPAAAAASTEPSGEPAPPAPPAPAAATAAPPHPLVAARVQAKIEKLMRDYATLQRELETVQRQYPLLRARLSGPWSPDESDPWREFLGRRLLWQEPVNPFSPPEVASRIALVTAPGVTGAEVSPGTAGWVWNAADGRLDAARDSAAIRACARERKRRYVQQTAGPRLDQTLKVIRAQVTMFQAFDGSMWQPGRVDAQQWDPLIDGHYLDEAPVNPLSPSEVSRQVVEVSTPGATGTAVDPRTAGWVWNSADRSLYAAGYDG